MSIFCLIVTKESRVNFALLRTFGSSVASQAGDKECSEALSSLGQVVTTVELAGGASRTQFREPLCSLYSDLLLQCSEDVVARLDFTKISFGQELVEFLVNTDCPLSLAVIQSCASLATALADQTSPPLPLGPTGSLLSSTWRTQLQIHCSTRETDTGLAVYITPELL